MEEEEAEDDGDDDDIVDNDGELSADSFASSVDRHFAESGARTASSTPQTPLQESSGMPERRVGGGIVAMTPMVSLPVAAGWTPTMKGRTGARTCSRSQARTSLAADRVSAESAFPGEQRSMSMITTS